MKKEKREINKKNLIIIILCLTALFMVVGLSTFAQMLAGQKQTSSVSANWNIGFESYEIKEKVSAEVTNVTLTPSIIYMDTKLTGSEGKLVMEFEIKNDGNIDAKVNGIYLIPNSNENDLILKEVTGIKEGDVLKAGETKKITQTIKYNKNATNLNKSYSSKLIIDYVQN